MPRIVHRLASWLCAVSLLAAVGAPGVAAADEVVSVVHPTNEVDEISIHDLRLLYGLYRRVWEGGRRVVLVVPESGTPSMAFLASQVFRRQNESDVNRHFLQAVFQGRIGQAPAQLSSELAFSLVRNDPGAIALVLAADAENVVGVRVVPVSDLSAALPLEPSGG